MSLVEEKVKSLIEPVINEFGFRLVRVQFSGGFSGRNDLQVMAEPLKNREMTVNDCQLLSGHISAILDVEDPVSEPYRLEISSPGVDRPLVTLEDYNRFSGELVKIRLYKMLDGRRRFDGRLSGVTKEGKIGLETSFGRFEFDPEIIDNARIDPREIFPIKNKISKQNKEF